MSLIRKLSGDRTMRWARFAGAGLELAAFAVVFALVGYVIDRWLGNSRLIGTAVTALVGFSLGLVRFIVFATQANRELPDSAVRESRKQIKH